MQRVNITYMTKFLKSSVTYETDLAEAFLDT